MTLLGADPRSRLFRLAPAILGLLLLAGCDRGRGADRIQNVVLVSIDDLGARDVGSYGYDRDTTPNLDALAAEGTLFEEAHTQQTWTLTSHMTMLTGVYPAVHGATMNTPARPNVSTLAEILKRRGFDTAGFVGLGGYMAPEFGMARGFDHYDIGVGDAPKDNKSRLAWLEEQARLRREDPRHRFFLFAHYYDVHSDGGTPFPYYAPPPYGTMFLPDGFTWNRHGDTSVLGELQAYGGVTEKDRRVIRALYDGGVRYCDQEGLGPLIQKLKDLGLYENTLIVVTADHGEEFFDHGAPTHQQPYRETSRVPLVFRGPGVPAGKRVPALVGLVDIAPTILSLLSIQAPPVMQGVDLSPLFEGKPIGRDAVYVDGVMRGWWTGKSKIVARMNGERWAYVTTVQRVEKEGTVSFDAISPGELYRIESDPAERHDLAAAEPGLARALRKRLLAWFTGNERVAEGLGVWVPRKRLLSEEEERRLRALGYVH